MENTIQVLQADLAHCAAAAARYESMLFGEKQLGQTEARYAKDLAKYYRDAAERSRDLYLKYAELDYNKAKLAAAVTWSQMPVPQEPFTPAVIVVEDGVVEKEVEKEEEEEDTFAETFMPDVEVKKNNKEEASLF